MLGIGKKPISEVPVSGEGTLALPAGDVEIRYAEDRKGRNVGTDGSNSKTWRGPSEDLDVNVTPVAGGEPLSIKAPRMITEGSGRTIYKKMGTVQAPVPGDYVISSSMTVTSDHIAPRIVARA